MLKYAKMCGSRQIMWKMTNCAILHLNVTPGMPQHFELVKKFNTLI